MNLQRSMKQLRKDASRKNLLIVPRAPGWYSVQTRWGFVLDGGKPVSRTELESVIQESPGYLRTLPRGIPLIGIAAS